MGRVRATSTLTVPILLNEAQRASSSGHLRYAKALWDLQNEDEEKTFREFLLGVKIFMTVPEKNIYQDRLLRFIATVASEVNSQDRIEFMEGLLKEIVKLTNAKDHAARWRACQVIHCIMTSLPPDASISGDIAEELQTALIERLEDSKPNVRVSSIRALARLVNPDEDNADFAACSVTKAFLNLLNYEKSKEVRKAIVASLPPAPCTQSALLERTRDESDDVRRITYLAIAEKIPLESLGADNGAILISRGLTDRAPSVAEAATAMVTSWLDTAFNGEPLALLKWLDATKNPKEGEAALKSLIESSRLNAVHIGKLAAEDNLGLRANFSGSSPCDDVESKIPAIAPLMSGEEALFWRVICESLSSEAATKGLAAANTAGATANIEAAAAGDRIEALEAALPLGIQDMIDIIAVHARAGPENRFVCAQLMALAGTCMDFTDAMGRRAAASLLEEVLLSACVDGTDNENGDAWYAATGQLLIKVHATPNELADAMLELLGTALERCGFEPSSEELWVNTLRTAALMLESLPSARPALASIAPFTFADVLNKLIQPAMLHDAEKVQEEAVRCLGLYCLLDGTPSSLANHMTLLRSCVVSTAQPLVVRTMAAKALGDLSLRHGVKVLDTFLEADEADPFHGAEPTIDMFLGVLQQWREEFADVASTTGSRSCKAARASSSSTSSTSLSPRDIEATAALGTAIVEALARLIAVNEFRQAADARRNEISAIEDSEVLRLIISLLLLNFDPATEPASRLRQCLTVFFERFSILSVTSQQYLATSLLPAARTAAADDILAGRRTATSSPLAPQVVRFMLQLLQLPVISADGKREPLGHEPLAELVMGEILGCAHNTKVPKPYLSALCKVPLALPMYDAGPETRETMLRIQVYATKAAEIVPDHLMEKDMHAVFERYDPPADTERPDISREEIDALLDGVLRHVEAFCSGFPQPFVDDGNEGSKRTTRNSSRASSVQTGASADTGNEHDDDVVDSAVTRQGRRRGGLTTASQVKFVEESEDDEDTGVYAAARAQRQRRPGTVDNAFDDSDDSSSSDEAEEQDAQEESESWYENENTQVCGSAGKNRRASTESVAALREALKENARIS